MKRRKKRVAIFLMVCMAVVALFVGCGTEGGNIAQEGDSGVKKKGQVVKLGYVNWAEGVAMTNLAKVILEDKMGYDVEMTMADAGPIFTSIANGNYDAFLDGWLPITHESYMQEYGENLVDLGYNFEGARIGLVVPKYVDIDSINDLNDVKDRFQGRIVGIDSGAGVMQATEKALEVYDLDYELVPGSGPTMTAALKKAIDNEEWIVVTGWQPHWKFARWELKFLEDPQKIYGEAENLHTIARKGLEEDMPEVAQFLKNFKLDDQQLGSLMEMIADNEEDAEDAAREWMQENEEVVNSWIPQE